MWMERRLLCVRYFDWFFSSPSSKSIPSTRRLHYIYIYKRQTDESHGILKWKLSRPIDLTERQTIDAKNHKKKTKTLKKNWLFGTTQFFKREEHDENDDEEKKKKKMTTTTTIKIKTSSIQQDFDYHLSGVLLYDVAGAVRSPFPRVKSSSSNIITFRSRKAIETDIYIQEGEVILSLSL